MAIAKKFYPYAGIPVIGTSFLLLNISKTDVFVILLCELIVVFGYIAAILDLKTKKVPNILIIAMLLAWVSTITPKLFIHTDIAISYIKDFALGFIIAGGLFLLVYLVSRKGLGGGDVKFIAVAGLYLGFNGIIPAILYGSILAGLCGLVLLLLKKIGRKDAMPLIPFLYIGILITLFYR